MSSVYEKLEVKLASAKTMTDDAAISAMLVNSAYEVAITRPATLNKAGEKSETYGETELTQIKSILDELDVGENDVFVDLGSGVGQVVQFVATSTNCKKAVGIELLKDRATLADNLTHAVDCGAGILRRKMQNRTLEFGDMFDPEFLPLITQEATIIFVNNFVFSPELSEKLKYQLLQVVKNGTRIVSTAHFNPRFREITNRNCGDFGAITTTKRMRMVANNVSWASKAIPFFLTTVDRARLHKFERDEILRKEKIEEKRRENALAKLEKERENSTVPAPVTRKRSDAHQATVIQEEEDVPTKRRRVAASVNVLQERQENREDTPTREEEPTRQEDERSSRKRRASQDVESVPVIKRSTPATFLPAVQADETRPAVQDAETRPAVWAAKRRAAKPAQKKEQHRSRKTGAAAKSKTTSMKAKSSRSKKNGSPTETRRTRSTIGNKIAPAEYKMTDGSIGSRVVAWRRAMRAI